VTVSYAERAGRAPTSSSRLSVVVFLAVAVLFSALRLLATTTTLAAPLGGRSQPTTQTWVFAAIWIVTYFAEAAAGSLLWRRRWTRPSARVAVVLFWVQLGVQGLRLLDLLGARISGGALPWSAFGTAVLLDVVVVLSATAAWSTSRRASGLLCVVLGWSLFVTAVTGADALLLNGLPLT
jgi:tryptophan-rich sensory protein